MSSAVLKVGFIPLVDAAPVIIAHELGFDEEEGVRLSLRAAPNWATLRDMLVLGTIEAAHMLAPIPIAVGLGLCGLPVRLDVLQILSVNGNTIGVSRDLAAKMRSAGYAFDFQDAYAAGAALIAASEEPPRIGVPYPFSIHAELLYHWLGALGVAAPQALQVRTVPPPLMAQAMDAGEIDAFCVGSPWGSIAVENGIGELLLPGTAIRAFAPEKVLAARHDWVESTPDLTARLMRAVWRAGHWLASPRNWMTASEILARPGYVNAAAEVIERALSGHLVISTKGEMREIPNFMSFHDGGAGFPWKSNAAWMASQLAGRTGLDRTDAMKTACAMFRTDLYRRNLRDLGVDMPTASEKIEGAVSTPTEVASERGRLILERDVFFDGFVFDPT